jgi:hypothetical protein
VRVVQPMMNYAAMVKKGQGQGQPQPPPKPQPVLAKPQAPAIQWVWTVGGRRHENDGWWQAMGLNDRADVQDAIRGHLGSAEVDEEYTIDFGNCQNEDEHRINTCSVTFRKTVEDGIRKVIVIHVGPAI